MFLIFYVFIVFIVLKLTGAITWSWWLVTLPIWGVLVYSVGVALLQIFCVFAIIKYNQFFKR